MDVLEMLEEARTTTPPSQACLDSARTLFVTATTLGTALPHPHRYRLQRQQWAVSLAAAVAIIVGGIATTSGITNDAVHRISVGGQHRDLPGPRPIHLHGAALTAYVVRQTLTALDGAAGYAQRTDQHDIRGESITWQAPNAYLDEIVGRETILETWAANGVASTTTLDYRDHTWWQDTFAAQAASAQTPASSIVATFHQPGLTMVGYATIDEMPTYKFDVDRPTTGSPGDFAMQDQEAQVWVDTTTYLPVRSFHQVAAIGPGSSGTPGTNATSNVVDDYTWQAAMPSVLAIFTVTPPADYQHITDPPLAGPGGR